MANIYIIPGRPIPLARPRFNGKHVFDCQKKEKAIVAQIIRLQHNNQPILDGPLSLDISFFMTIPKRKGDFLWHIARPDLSNMVKFYEDVATGILYIDDQQISEITTRKIYDQYPRTEFTLTQL